MLLTNMDEKRQKNRQTQTPEKSYITNIQTHTITFKSDADISRFVLDKREFTFSLSHVYNLDCAGQVKCYMMGLYALSPMLYVDSSNALKREVVIHTPSYRLQFFLSTFYPPLTVNSFFHFFF